MRLPAAALVLAALTSTALAQPGMTPPGGGYGPPPTQAPPPPQPQPVGAYTGYQPTYGYYAPQQQPELKLDLKSPSTAYLWSIGVTLGGFALMGASADENNEGLAFLGLGMVLVGPSAGHIYAGESSHAIKTSLLRAGGLSLLVLGAIASIDDCYDYCYEDSNEGEWMMWLGGATLVGLTIYDLFDAGRAATRHNDRARRNAMMFAPTMMSKANGGTTPGLAFSATF